MRIRARLTLWYAGVLLASVLLMAGGMYYELVVERRAAKAEHRRKDPMEDEVLEIVLIYCAPSLLVAVVGGWWLMRKALAPLDGLTRAAEQIHMHNLRERLPRSHTGDEVDRLAAVLNDMTQRLEGSFAQISEFTMNASHELKTPLAVMHGEIELSLQDRATTPAQREAFASLLDEIQRLMKIVSGLAFLAKADAGQVVLVRESVALHELVADVAADSQILAQPNRIQVDSAGVEAVLISGDRHRLRQMLLSLAENAVRYNQAGGTIRFALAQTSTHAELQIANTGPGIPGDQLPRVFVRFFRGDVSHSARVEGSGLGLTIARSIVMAHSGNIHIDSEQGGWTTVTICLPLAPSVSNGHSG